jgi:hypothetical protein
VIKNDKQEVIPILDPKAKKVREPIDNRWLYDHDLNMQDANIATADTDGDGYTNTEEFLANTDPKDKNSNPGLQTKIEYKEVVKDPMTIKFNTYLDDKDMTFRRTEPADKAFNTEHIKVGDTFPSEKAGVPRFKVTKILPPKEGKQHVAVLEDLLLKGTPIEVEIRHTFEMPSRRAKLVCKLGKEEEKVVSEAEEFYFAAEPDLKFTVKSITDEEVTLEFTPKGKTEKSSKTFKIPPPP